jgi:hypothetical protein
MATVQQFYEASGEELEDLQRDVLVLAYYFGSARAYIPAAMRIGHY